MNAVDPAAGRIGGAGGNGRVIANGEYQGFKSWRERTDDDRMVNNEVRTALLKALGQAFNIKEGCASVFFVYFVVVNPQSHATGGTRLH